MAGNPDNANIWANGDVYIGDEEAETPMDSEKKTPNGEDFGSDWDLGGLLDGSEGFTESISLDSNDFFAWGGVFLGSTKQHLKITRTFTAYEDNETIMSLRYPGSDLEYDDKTGGYAGSLMIDDLQKRFKIGFQTRTGSNIKRVVTRLYAQIEEWGDSTENEEGVATFPFTVAIFPEINDDGVPVFWDVYKGPRAASS